MFNFRTTLLSKDLFLSKENLNALAMEEIPEPVWVNPWLQPHEDKQAVIN